MNRAERRAAQRRKRAWLRGVEQSGLPEDVKRVARVIYAHADEDGYFYTTEDNGEIIAHPGRAT